MKYIRNRSLDFICFIIIVLSISVALGILPIMLVLGKASVLFSNPILANEQLELEETADQYELIDDVKEDLNFIDYDEELDFEWNVIDI